MAATLKPGGSIARAQEVARARALEFVEPELLGIPTVVAPAGTFKGLLRELRQVGFRLISDIVFLDYLEYTALTPERFGLAYHLTDPLTAEKVFVRVFVADGQAVPTVTDLWPGASFMEREVFDMMGIAFEGHPDLRKILTPEDLDGHVLRKDFPLGETPTLFREGRFIDPAAFRAGLVGRDPGLTGWRGGARKATAADREPPQRVDAVAKGPRAPAADAGDAGSKP